MFAQALNTIITLIFFCFYTSLNAKMYFLFGFFCPVPKLVNFPFYTFFFCVFLRFTYLLISITLPYDYNYKYECISGIAIIYRNEEVAKSSYIIKILSNHHLLPSPRQSTPPKLGVQPPNQTLLTLYILYIYPHRHSITILAFSNRSCVCSSNKMQNAIIQL